MNLYTAIKNLGIEFLKTYNQLPELTQDDANLLTQKFIIIHQYITFLENNPFEVKQNASTDVHSRLG
jgi:hypothetical protein